MSLIQPVLAVALAVMGAASPVKATSCKATENVVEKIEVKRMRKEQGHCYIARLRLSRDGDRGKTRSSCALLEDGKPLPTPRSLHALIRNEGKGRYSHWTPTTLYFSTSDNTDPRTNKRVYTLVSRRDVVRKTARVTLTGADNTYRITTAPPVEFRRLTLRNRGAEPVVVTTTMAGRPDLSSAKAMLASVLRPGMTDEQKCVAIWKLLLAWRYHYYPADGSADVHDPVKFLNVYGYGFCDDGAQCFAVLARAAGLRARLWGLGGHVVAEAWYGGRWHMFDPDHEVYYRAADGHVACVEELAAHPEIMTRKRTDPIGSLSKGMARLYTTTENNRAINTAALNPRHEIAPTLEPGDEVVFDATARDRVRRILFKNQARPPVFGNGRLTRKLTWAGRPKAVTLPVSWPYVLIGGELLLPGDSGAEVGVAQGVKPNAKTTYEPLKAARKGKSLAFDLDAWLASRKQAPYGFALRIRSPKGLDHATLVVHFQFAPRALTKVEKADNVFQVRLASPDRKRPLRSPRVDATYEWDEVQAGKAAKRK